MHYCKLKMIRNETTVKEFTKDVEALNIIYLIIVIDAHTQYKIGYKGLCLGEIMEITSTRELL